MTHRSDTVIEDAYVERRTALHPAAARPLRGNCVGLGERPVVDHLMRLGVTAIELLPVHAFFDDRHLVQQGLRNYWGYNTTGFFAPAPRYLSPGAGPGELDRKSTRLNSSH